MSHTAPPMTPERILSLAWAFAPPLVIEAAVRHRVFDTLANQALTLGELAQATGASSRGLSAIANVLVGFDIPASPSFQPCRCVVSPPLAGTSP